MSFSFSSPYIAFSRFLKINLVVLKSQFYDLPQNSVDSIKMYTFCSKVIYAKFSFKNCQVNGFPVLFFIVTWGWGGVGEP